MAGIHVKEKRNKRNAQEIVSPNFSDGFFLH